MEFLLGLAVAFVKALAASAGTAAGSKLVEAVFPKFEASNQQAVLTRLRVAPTAADETKAHQVLFQYMRDDPMFRQQTQVVLQTVAPQFLTFAEQLAESLRKNPDLAEALAAGRAETDKMPVTPIIEWPKFKL